MYIPTKRIELDKGYKFVPDTEIIVAIAEKSDGNESVGNMWHETKIFDAKASLEDVIAWAYQIGVGGKLILTIPDQRDLNKK